MAARRSKRRRPVATIGYERASLDQVIDKLRGAEVELLIDVRAVASSRRAGFSKTILAASLAEAGVDYLHLRGLGTPKEGRQASRAGRKEEMRAIFSAHMETPEARRDYDTLKHEIAGRRAALLCFEAEAKDCHRRILTERLERDMAVEVLDL